MNYRRLEYFLTVVDYETITAAAQSIPLSQPALSRQIKTLEDELQLVLFSPSGSRLMLTPAGRAFVPMARQLLSQARMLEEGIKLLRHGYVPSLKLAATAASIRSFIAPFIKTTTKDDPVLLVKEMSHHCIPDSLNHGMDFIISPLLPNDDLMVLPLGAVPIKAHVKCDHPLTKYKRHTLTIADLAKYTVLLPSHRSISRLVIDQAINEAGQGFPYQYECDDGSSTHALAMAGHGIGITTEPSHFETYSMFIEDANQQCLALPLYAAWSREHFAQSTIAGLAQRIQDFLQDQPWRSNN